MQRSSDRVVTNYYKLNVASPIFKYHVVLSPEVPQNQPSIFFGVMRACKKQISEKLSIFMPINFVIYSPYQADEVEFDCENEKYQYKVKLQCSGILDMGQESLAIFSRLIKLSQLAVNFRPIGKKYFNPKNEIAISNFRLKIWPGCLISTKFRKDMCMINLDLCYKVIREKTLLDLIQDLTKVYRGDVDRVKSDLKNQSVITL
jgi:hypothetical protein